MIKYEIYAYDNGTGLDIGYMESFESEQEALLKIDELKQNVKFNEWNYAYRIYQAIKK